MASSLELLPLYEQEDISEFRNSNLSYENGISGGNISTRKQNKIDYDLSLNSNGMNNRADNVDIKPDLKDLEQINKISSYISHDMLKQDIQSHSVSGCEDMLKQEIPSHFASTCGVKEEIIYCQFCSYGDVNLSRLKHHIFREHPTGAAVVANCFKKSNCRLHDVKLLCIRETCTFSTNDCNLYEEHLMSCCPIHQTFSEEEKERLKSTVEFILGLFSKHNLKSVPGFLDYFSIFNKTFNCKDDKMQIAKDLDLEYNSSSMLSGSVSCLGMPLNCNTGIEFENSLSSFPAPVLFKTQETDINGPVGQTNVENTSLYVGEQERRHEQFSKSNSFHETLASSPNEVGTNLVQTRDDHDISENIFLMIDVAETQRDITSLKEETKEKIRDMKIYLGTVVTSLHLKDMSYGVCCPKEFKCNDCGKTFSWNSQLILHRRTHTGKELLKCKDFINSFSRNRRLVEHRKKHTGEKIFLCDVCGMTFSDSCHLRVHRRTHSREKPFICSECCKTFRQSGSLIRHRRIHTGEKPFICNDCGKNFRDSSSLIVHMRIHTGEKPFICNDCGKTFSQNISLVVHRRTHTGEKPFSCDDCGKTFIQKGQLIVHGKTHMGEQPFKCYDCGKTFREDRCLFEHKKTHTGEKLFTYNEC